NSLRSAISVGIGLFIAFVGFVDSGVIRPGSGTPVPLGVGGSLEGWPLLLCLFGFLLLVVLHQRHSKGS
ncbi:NCS2 family permease, partial [Cutibacterium acnes]|nr:NCS2 family permease [Cutibacterium acnes]